MTEWIIMKRLHSIFSVILSITLISMVSSSYAEPTSAVGRVVWVKGSFTATGTDKPARDLKKLSIIYLKDTLKTENNSQAQIVFTDNTMMTFKPNSKLSIDQYAFSPPTKKKTISKYIVSLIEGGFRTITGLIAKSNPKNYQVNTPVATIGVRGTDYAVYLDNKGELFIGGYSGIPCVSNPSGGLCLSKDTKFANVSSGNKAPIPLTQQPAGFANKLEIVPAKIAYTSSPTSPTSPSSPSSSAPQSKTPGSSNSFCIVQ